MITERAKPPAHALWWWPIPRIGTCAETTSAKTKRPMTIEGTPFKTSSQSFTWSASFFGANSLT